ncbi:MAG: hypothetical protein ACJAZN_002429 [Planctomycetota bacterium]|jgi:hypothetical protein
MAGQFRTQRCGEVDLGGPFPEVYFGRVHGEYRAAFELSIEKEAASSPRSVTAEGFAQATGKTRCP